MKLKTIIKALSGITVIGSSDIEVLGITDNSKAVMGGFIFAALSGRHTDGYIFINEARARGAVCIICDDSKQKTLRVERGETVVFSKNPRKTAAEIAKILYGKPDEKMKIVGITGTKGKSTTAAYLYECLKSCGVSCISIGTLGIAFPDGSFQPTSNTTPTSTEIFSALERAYSGGATVAVIEVSSQALSDMRVFGISFDLVIYTGFSHDHIGEGEHKNMREYFFAKRRLFTDYGAEVAVVFDDGEYSRRISYGIEKIIRCGREIYDEYYVSEIFTSSPALGFRISGVDFSIGLSGEFNVMNATLALAAASELTGRKISDFRRVLPEVRVRGRFEIYELSGKNIIIDFAHNAESMRNVFIAARKMCFGHIIAVFGSVGERAYSRRIELARIAEEYADFSIITSDNPGSEAPEKICIDIKSAFRDPAHARIIPDRKEAIIHALDIAERGDYVLLLGKGHEEYQYIRGENIAFSEVKILSSLGARRQL